MPDGGFTAHPGGAYRTDATAWVALALAATSGMEHVAEAARARLVSDQFNDGRVDLSQSTPQAFWPTALAVLAWHNFPRYREAQLRGVSFLLTSSGIHYQRQKDLVVAHNPSLYGWSWIAKTYSWVEPTSLVLLALELTGKGMHERACEARKMLLDRQIESGGWNYGNKKVFGTQLWPMPESTGLALNALAGRVDYKSVARSISYLRLAIGHLRTPLSFGWGCLGLSAWGELPQIDQQSLLSHLRKQETYGTLETGQLALLLIALRAERGLLSGITGDSP